MTPSAHEIARELLATIGVPVGHVNALVVQDEQGDVIRLLVDKEYLRLVDDRHLKQFGGLRVTVEKRGKARAY